MRIQHNTVQQPEFNQSFELSCVSCTDINNTSFKLPELCTRTRIIILDVENSRECKAYTSDLVPPGVEDSLHSYLKLRWHRAL